MAKRSTIGENPLDVVVTENPLEAVVPVAMASPSASIPPPLTETFPEEIKERLAELEAENTTLKAEIVQLRAEVSKLQASESGRVPASYPTRRRCN